MSRIVSLLVLAFIGSSLVSPVWPTYRHLFLAAAFLGVMTIPTLADRFPAQFAAAERYAHSTALLVVGLALNYFRKVCARARALTKPNGFDVQAKEMVTGKLRPPVALHHD